MHIIQHTIFFRPAEAADNFDDPDSCLLASFLRGSAEPGRISYYSARPPKYLGISDSASLS